MRWSPAAGSNAADPAAIKYHQGLRRFAVIAACLALSTNAVAEPEPEPGAEPEGEGAPEQASFEGVGAAVLPGLVVHGTGLWVRGDVATARKLATAEGIGLGMAAVGGGILAATGGSRRVSTPTIPLLVGGFGLFVTSWLADIYGTAGGGTRGATPRLAIPPLDLQLGAVGIYDPVFDYGAFTRVAGELRLGRWRLAPELLVALGDDNQRLRGDVGYRLRGDPRGNGSHFDLVGSGRAHRYGDDGFTSYSGELQAVGRLELSTLGASIDGAFAELSAGLGIEVVDYRLSGVDTDISDMLLAGFGFGMYLGDAASVARGEIRLYYDHRRDEFVGGFSPGMQASGFGGFFGAALDLDLGRRWGVVSKIEWGSAALFGASLRYRMGGAK